MAETAKILEHGPSVFRTMLLFFLGAGARPCRPETDEFTLVIPAQAGISLPLRQWRTRREIPALAGMTGKVPLQLRPSRRPAGARAPSLPATGHGPTPG